MVLNFTNSRFLISQIQNCQRGIYACISLTNTPIFGNTYLYYVQCNIYAIKNFCVSFWCSVSWKTVTQMSMHCFNQHALHMYNIIILSLWNTITLFCKFYLLCEIYKSFLSRIFPSIRYVSVSSYPHHTTILNTRFILPNALSLSILLEIQCFLVHSCFKVNRRMDDWISVSLVDMKRGIIEETPKEIDTMLELNGRERKVTRNLKRKHDEINHVQKVCINHSIPCEMLHFHIYGC